MKRARRQWELPGGRTTEHEKTSSPGRALVGEPVDAGPGYSVRISLMARLRLSGCFRWNTLIVWYLWLGDSMSNGLFRSYPAVGVQIVPATYGAGKFGYILLGLFPILVVWWAGAENVEKSPWLLWGLAIYTPGAAFAITVLRSLKLEIRMDGISYANLFRETNFLAFSEISTAVILTDLHGRQGVLPRFTLPNTIEITPNAETGKSKLKIPLVFFPDAARAQLMHLLRPEELDIRT